MKNNFFQFTLDTLNALNIVSLPFFNEIYNVENFTVVEFKSTR